MLFKDISYLELCRPFCLAQRNHLSNFGKGHCEIILNLAQWFRRCHLKDFLSRALVALMFVRAEPFAQFGRMHYVEHFCEFILNFNQWFKSCCLKQIIMDNRRTMDVGQRQ